MRGPGGWPALLGGSALIGVALASLLSTIVVPRSRPSRFTSVVVRSVRALFLSLARRFPRYETRDHVLTLEGPATLVALLGSWLACLFVGYGLIFWAIDRVAFADALRESGSSIFTLGFARVQGSGATTTAFLAAATGLGVIALEIAYLPTLYSAFNRRETLVTLLSSRAGSPAWGPELLWRHQGVDIVDSLPRLYADWEEWAADLVETHTTYPVLMLFRSPEPYRSWVIGLLTVLDAAALHLAVAPKTAPSEARLCLRMGFMSFQELAATLNLPFDPDPRPDARLGLSFEEFASAVAMLEDAGFPVERSAEEAWPDFRGWRVNYEQAACALADFVVAPPALWSGTRRHVAEAPIPPRRPVDRRPDDPDPAGPDRA